MNAEQKAELIEWARKWIEPAARIVQDNPSDQSARASLALYEIALASLTAKPEAWAHRLVNKRNGTLHPWVYGSAEAEASEGDVFRIEVMQLYTAPPVPLLKPVKLSAGAWVPFYGQMMERQEVVAALREAGIQIEGEE